MKNVDPIIVSAISRSILTSHL